MKKEKMLNKIIVNADDYGFNERYTHAIVQAFREQLISSTSVCANGTYLKEAYELACENDFSDKIGIHINLTQGIPLTKNISEDPFFCKDGLFHKNIDRYKMPNRKQIMEVRKEVDAQIECLLEMGYSLTHADSHHHIHTAVFLEKIIAEELQKYQIKKIRLYRNVGKMPPLKRKLKKLSNLRLQKQGFATAEYFGEIEDYQSEMRILKERLCEIMVHPDYDEAHVLVDRMRCKNGYAVGRPLEEIKRLTEGTQLISYRDI